jgi:hypothetical protein
MTDEKHRSAEAVNPAGHSLSVYRVRGAAKDRAVWLNFSLSKESTDMLSASNGFMYRIDSAPAVTADLTNKYRSIGVVDSQVEPKWINLRIWHGEEREGRNEAIKELMAGKSIVIRYGLFTGGTKETSFDLEGSGSGKAIAEALGIGVEPDAALEAAWTAFVVERMSHTRACFAGPDGPAKLKCATKLEECEKRADLNAEALRSCMTGVR